MEPNTATRLRVSTSVIAFAPDGATRGLGRGLTAGTTQCQVEGLPYDCAYTERDAFAGLQFDGRRECTYASREAATGTNIDVPSSAL